MSAIEYALHDPKAAAATAATTVITGAGLTVDLIPEAAGTVATLVGIVLSSVLIYTHFRNGRQENRKLREETRLYGTEADLKDLELAALKRQLREKKNGQSPP